MSGHWKTHSATAMALVLSACGGGGGGGVKSTPTAPARTVTSLPDPMPDPVTQPSGEDFDTIEYRNSSAAVGSNAIGAWQQGATGKGITIGFVDTGLVPTHSDFDGRIHPDSRDVDGNRPMEDLWGHGTALAGIAAAARDGTGMQGIAFDATIFMAKADQGCPTRCHFSNNAVIAGIDAARIAGAKVINLSLIGLDVGEISDAARRAFDAGIVIVVAASNSGSSPSEFATDFARLAPNQVIIVGGLGISNGDGSINYDVPSIYTTPAGSSQSSFLAAPGWLNSGSYLLQEGVIDRFSGTSFAAPVVAGAIALIAQAYPMLTAQQIVSLLYVSADDLGATGTDSIFGRGRLNIGRAFQPVGTMRMASTGLAPPVSIGSLPAAAGDAARRGSLKATVLDEFDRPFDFDLARGLAQLAEAGPLARSMSTGLRSTSMSMGPVSLAFTVDGSAMRSTAFRELDLPPAQENQARLLAATAIGKLTARSSLALGFGTGLSGLRSQLTGGIIDGLMLSDNATQMLGFDGVDPNSISLEHKHAGWRISVGGERGSVPAFQLGRSEPPYSLVGLSVDRRLHRGQIRFGLARLTEAQTVLGSSIDNLFGKPGSRTLYADAEIDQQLGNGWSASGSYRRGWTAFSNGHFTTSAFSLSVTKLGTLTNDDAVAFRISQPLRVERGAIELLLPVGWDYIARVAIEGPRRLSLRPSGRELVLEAAYQRGLSNGFISLNLFGRRDPGHMKNNEGDLGMAVRANLKL